MKNNVLEVIQKLLSSENTKLLMTRAAVVVILAFVFLVWINHEKIVSGFLDTRLENVLTTLEQKRDERYQQVVREQVQSSYALIQPDSVWVMSYRPININNFLDMVYYEGRLPNGKTHSDFQGITVNKISKEYQTHILGSNYNQVGPYGFVYQMDFDVTYRYSCPIYNLKNIYAGVIVYLWYDTEPYTDRADRDSFEERLSIFCGQSSRSIGRAK